MNQMHTLTETSTSNPSGKNEWEATSPPLFPSSVLPEEDELVDENGDSMMFGTFLADGINEDHCYQTYPCSSDTSSHPRSSPSVAFTSPRPSSSSSSSSSSSLGYSSSSLFTSFIRLPAPVPEHEEASSSWSPTSPTSPDFSTSRDQDPFGLASLLAFGAVEDDHVAGKFEQDQQHDPTDDLVEADRLQWDKTDKTLEGVPRRREEEPQRAQPTRPSPSATTSFGPTVFAPPLTSDHSNPYHELGRRYHLQRSSLSSPSSSNLLILNPRASLPPNLKRKSQSLPLRKSKPYTPISTSPTAKPRPRSASFGVMPTFVERALVASATSFPATQEEKEEENFETALARLRREKGEMKYGFPRLRWLDAEVRE